MIEKIGPYRVYERLGVGGMGEVYKAYDDRLDRWVAIKRIRPDREDAEDNRERFKREARATARLNHPSIVHLYGIFQEDESDCIVMEYVEGKSLDSIVSEQPLDPLRVASLGHEIASGLAEAHSNGILHRDLKAENIIITNRGRAKILDFGLAKPILRDELDPILTGKGQLVGTSRAMSPEYVSGEAVDHRSDLFSLGVLLYECLTGHSPFKAHNTLATLKQVMLHKQPSIVELDSKVPQELSDLIDRLLAKSPDDRPQSAHEVALEFGRLTGQISSGTVERPASSGGYLKASSTMTPFTASDTVLDLRPRRRWMTVAAVIAVLLIIAFFFGRRFRDQPPELDPALESGRQIRIVLGDFGNQTDEALLGDTVGEAFRASLGQSRLNTVFSRSQIREALARMQLPPDAIISREVGGEICLREGAERLIMGQISKLGGTYSLMADVVDPQGDTTTYSAKEIAQGKDEILAAIDRLSQTLRHNLGESIEQIEETARPLEKVTTPNLDALKSYSLGVDKIAEGKRDEAINFFDRALALDPGFAMAHAKLGVLYSNANNRDKAMEHLDQALAKEDRLSEVEKFYVQGWIAIWRGTPEDVIQVWSLMSDLYPQVYAGHQNLGLSHWLFNNDFPKASEALGRAAKAAQGQGEVSKNSWHRGYCSLVLGKPDIAKSLFEASNSDEGRKGLLQHRLAVFEIDETIDDEIASLDRELDRQYYQALIQLSQGAFEVSLSGFEELQTQALAEQQNDLLFRAWVGTYVALEQLGRFSEASALLDHALELGQDFLLPTGLRTESSPFIALAVMAKAEARRDELERPRQILRRLQAVVERIPVQLWQAHLELLQGEILRAEGKTEEARQQFVVAIETASDLFQARESLARLLLQIGDSSAALEQFEWLSSHRGRAVSEYTASGFGQESSITLHTLAYFEQAQLLQRLGETDRATENYKTFLEIWSAAGPEQATVSKAQQEISEP